jgi:(p)ppGpp synthase/HD superfamily hydrolase
MGKMSDLVTVLRAAEMAAHWHADQRRKGAAAEPYINHLLEVSWLVAAAGAGTNTIVAALLHDAVEDQRIAPAVIAREFGDEVASIVLEVTNDKELPKAERKALQIATAATKSEAAKMIKLADKTSNVRAIAKSPPADWSATRRQDYISWAVAVVGGLCELVY